MASYLGLNNINLPYKPHPFNPVGTLHYLTMATLRLSTWTFLTLVVYIYAFSINNRSSSSNSDHSLGKLPTLGWNSWNAYNCDINEDHFLSASKALIENGLYEAGYNYVNSRIYQSPAAMADSDS
jgi:hypothetical protein